MGKLYNEIPAPHFGWIEKQHMFWVATAPLSAQGHVNISPKGTADCFHVVNSKQVWYEDLSGSGVETISHVRENGRITIMFCAFDGPPRILRLFGVGTVHEYGSSEYNRLISATSRKPGSRAAIVIDIYQVGSACGYAVPIYEFVMHRTQLARMSDKIEDVDRALDASRSKERHLSCDTKNEAEKESKSKLSLRTYWLLKNMSSLDGLPGLLSAPDAVLEMAPQNNFDQGSARPPLHRNKSSVDTARDGKLLALGFVIGGVTAIALARLVGGLKR